MKKIFSEMSKMIIMIAVAVIIFGTSAAAKTVTVQTASFTTYPMQYYNEQTSNWHIAEGAVYDTTCMEYVCVHNFIQMAPNKNYAAIKSYELQSDADFFFEGTVALDLPDFFFEGDVRNHTTVNFFVATDKGKIIYPTDGSSYLNVSLTSGTIQVSGEASGMSAGDKIYFVAFTDSEICSPFLTTPMTVYETEYGGARGLPISDTNNYSDIQGEFSWEFLYSPMDTLQFGSKEITYDEYAEVSKEGTDADTEKAQNSNVVIATENAKPLPTQKETQEDLTNAKLVITAVIISAALVLIVQTVVLEVLKKKKGGNKDA